MALGREAAYIYVDPRFFKPMKRGSCEDLSLFSPADVFLS